MEDDIQKSNDGKLTATRMIIILAIAVAVDGFEWFLDLILIGVVLNYIVGIFAWLTFAILFHMWGFSMWDAKKGKTAVLSLAGAFGVEVVLFGVLPAWTAWAIYTVFAEMAKNTAKKVPGGKAIVEAIT